MELRSRTTIGHIAIHTWIPACRESGDKVLVFITGIGTVAKAEW